MGKKSVSKKSSSTKLLNVVEIPTDGSLGVLALGAVGIKAWRKKREEQQKKSEKNSINE